jgi:tetratricopeptide (TPR) repeat protein
MSEETERVSDDRRLNTWKEIAGYFGRTERTVKRWESTRKLPVRRMPNGPRSVVFAYERELAVWLKGREADDLPPYEAAEASAAELTPPTSLPHPPSRRILPIITAAGVVIGAFAGLWVLTGSPFSSIQQPRTSNENTQAASLYRAGLYEWQTRTPEGLTRGVDYFTQSIVHDPQFAPAYAGLAMSFDLLREYTTMSPEYAYPRAKAAAERAIALDPSLGIAHAALAFADFYWSRDPAEAKREFRQALALSPRDATVHHWFATMLMVTGDFAAAVSEIDKAEALDYESTAIQADKGFILYFAGQKSEATALLKRIEQSEPSFYSTHRYLALIAYWRGDDEGYLDELASSAKLRKDQSDSALAAAGRTGLLNGGHFGMLKAILAEQLRRYSRGQTSAYSVALAFAATGNEASMLDYLKRSLDRREPETIAMRIDPAFDRLRTEPQFRELVMRAGT